MVKTETSHERRELLKIMQASADTNALKSFVRYKGLDLLWSWMVDASEDRNKYRYEVYCVSYSMFYEAVTSVIKCLIYPASASI